MVSGSLSPAVWVLDGHRLCLAKPQAKRGQGPLSSRPHPLQWGLAPHELWESAGLNFKEKRGLQKPLFWEHQGHGGGGLS